MSDVVQVRSDRCGLDEPFLAYGTGDAERGRLPLGPGWPRQWTAAWRSVGGEVACTARGPGVRTAGRVRGKEKVVPLRRPEHTQAGDALDAERRRRREQAVPQRPAPPGSLGDRLRRTSLLALPEEDDEQ